MLTSQLSRPSLDKLLWDCTVLRKHTVRARFSRQLLRGRDGGTVGLDWFRDCQHSSNIPAAAPIVLVLHGLAGAAPALVWHARNACSARLEEVAQSGALSSGLLRQTMFNSTSVFSRL